MWNKTGFIDEILRILFAYIKDIAEFCTKTYA